MEQRQLRPGKTHSLPKRRGMLPLKHWRSDKIREGEHFARLPGSGVRGLRPFSGSGLEQSASSTTYILSRQSVTLVVAAWEYPSIQYRAELRIGSTHQITERAATWCSEV